MIGQTGPLCHGLLLRVCFKLKLRPFLYCRFSSHAMQRKTRLPDLCSIRITCQRHNMKGMEWRRVKEKVKDRWEEGKNEGMKAGDDKNRDG